SRSKRLATMIDLNILRDKGITEESLMQKLAGDPLQWGNLQAPSGNPPTPTLGEGGPQETDREKVGRLLHRIRSPIQEGMNRNFQDYRIHHALDLAWDTPFRQVTPTMLSSFLDKDPNSEQVYQALSDWGYTHMIQEQTDPKTGKKTKVFNFPAFFQVI